MTWVAVVLLLITGTGTSTNTHAAPKPPPHVEGPCKAIHYGRDGKPKEISMLEVVANRMDCPGRHCISTFVPRPDVEGFIAVRNKDLWRIGQNWKAQVVFLLKNDTYSRVYNLQPVDYQNARDVTSDQCRVETSEPIANFMGWSLWQGYGRTTAYIVSWQR